MTTESQPPPWLTITLVVLYYILYPVFLLFKAVWYILLLLSTPIIYIGRVFLAVSLIPWRIFTRFETLWYFIASAILLGVLFGLILHFTMRAFVLILRLDREPPPELKAPSGHDAVSYRKAREAKKRKQLEEQQTLATQARLMASQPLLQEAVREARKMPLSVTPVSPISPGNSGPSRPGLLQQTILEHSDEDDDSSVF
ncbi:hypothetical protein LTR99_007927 [Exophiala xenobiotica]|uniref:Uncharacterized protein n=1 Tax=Vermiconidia calcicola TaxID=1690605 RepID=A0AAV9Q4L6_9PEZI|nr:hypothetical protein LTR92_003497 [Exophiala xenobiotica]KAK5535103.1 hypothetical protein LTR25_006111 [Vermiconidia calcicola]KAK5535561.1 hypothetical protein LTR23_008299 [Chaetothyriales sp. CCFEE 6169]KAK5209313.1 hypothetical protein LTR41_004849 [Exophiala xenobiotica]KAK5223905.1 hypothetical protein LTR72_005291 [Exophiala xenobiotica]